MIEKKKLSENAVTARLLAACRNSLYLEFITWESTVESSVTFKCPVSIGIINVQTKQFQGEIKKEYKIPEMKRASNFCAVNM